MRILNILKDLLRMEGQDFIRGLYKQLLNRQPNSSELNWNNNQLSRNTPKILIVKNLLISHESRQLYQQPIANIINSQPTIADILSSFFRANVNTFIASAYKEILGKAPNKIDVNKALLLSRGIITPNLFIAELIENTFEIKSNPPTAPLPTIAPPEVAPPIATPPIASLPMSVSKIEDEQIPLYSPENLQIDNTKGSDEGANQILSVRKTIPNPYVAILSNGRFWGGNGGAVLSSHGKVYTDLSSEIGDFSPFLHSQLPSQPNCYLENVAVLQSSVGFNFFHWMLDVVARLDLVRQSKIPIDNYITPVLFPFQEELLTMLDVPGGKRIQMQPQLYLQAKQLIAPSYTGSHTGILPKWACDFLRRELLLNRGVEKLEGYERIYISRAHAQHRKVVNEEEVMNVLGSYGFQSVNLEFESVARKIQIFNSAKMIVAPHGAGLTNLLFCIAGTKVVEIFSPNWIYPCYRVISHYMDLDYEFITGKGQKLAYRTDMRKIPENIIVDIKELMPILERNLH